ncbi:hypothetical protein Xen7305DRAFT_00039590 [Xenococcus sp. PCC 7305]|uniref:hypothetical protein n=1 Tax=Xenococcus sp. PCC 7305 TaxID=102125 RepID=UPI0002AC224D|nr:hypothetical protein [Xenococcus sp. PCC 7305]ELS04231.1 hypothetical protein Xen7305DRAFT_00039590 [Xenococcus sp. PCC 7305]
MNKTFMFIMALFCIPTTSLRVAAADFDSSEPFVCTVIDVTECIMGGGCKEVTAEEINLPRYLWIDTRKKTIQSKKEADESRISNIDQVKVVDNKLMLQGAEQGREDVQDGFGWTVAVMEDTGYMVMTASGDLVGNIAFGVCTTP